MNADQDTTKHRYFRPDEIACVTYSMDRGWSILAGEVPPDWLAVPQPQRLLWVSVIDEIRRGASARQVYEFRSGESWDELERDEQIRVEMQQLLITGMGSAQR